MSVYTKIINYIDINDVVERFCELTGWTSTRQGLWNADFTKTVFEVVYPTNTDGHVLNGKSKYIYLLDEPEDELMFSKHKKLDKNIDSLRFFMVREIYPHTKLGNVPYFEIGLQTIILWLMKVGELEQKDAIYHQEW